MPNSVPYWIILSEIDATTQLLFLVILLISSRTAFNSFGWTLLNRGIVIGSIRFNIEELIRGLSGRDCSELIKKENRLLNERQKYNQMFSVALTSSFISATNCLKRLFSDKVWSIRFSSALSCRWRIINLLNSISVSSS